MRSMDRLDTKDRSFGSGTAASNSASQREFLDDPSQRITTHSRVTISWNFDQCRLALSNVVHFSYTLVVDVDVAYL